MYFCNVVSLTRLYQFIALYNSIQANTKVFNIFVLCMDDDTFRILEAARLNNVILTKLRDLENDNLLELKSKRQIEEYCWTLKPVFLTHILEQNEFIDRITYLDADLYFHNNPELLFVGSENCSVLLSEHDFNENIKNIEESVGKFNAGFISFKNNENGRLSLKWWKEQCLKWCFNTTVTGQFGDQKYLNNMIELFKKVCAIKVPGVNIAPWNDEKYKYRMVDEKLFINNSPLILYHYCGFRVHDKNSCILMFGDECHPIIHHPYMKAIKESILFVENIDPNFIGNFIERRNEGKFKIFSLDVG